VNSDYLRYKIPGVDFQSKIFAFSDRCAFLTPAKRQPTTFRVSTVQQQEKQAVCPLEENL